MTDISIGEVPTVSRLRARPTLIAINSNIEPVVATQPRSSCQIASTKLRWDIPPIITRPPKVCGRPYNYYATCSQAKENLVVLARRELARDIDEPREQPVNAIVRGVRQTMPVASKCKASWFYDITISWAVASYLKAFSQVVWAKANVNDEYIVLVIFQSYNMRYDIRNVEQN